MGAENQKLKKRPEADEEIRLNKFLSDAGFCSRREADRLIEQGRVTVDGQPALVGQKITLRHQVKVDGRNITREEERILIAFNKPVGVECTADLSNPHNIIDYIDYPKRIYPIGRLDKNSQGLILLTNDGSLVNNILKGSNYHEKEYVVTVNKQVTDDFVRKMSSGVKIGETVTRKCQVNKVSRYVFRIILTQGLNRQIRRMCETLGYNVQKLERIRIMNIKLGSLPKGSYRDVTLEEFQKMTEQFN